MTTRKTLRTCAIALIALGTTIAPAAFATPTDDISVKVDTRYLETDWGVEKVYSTLAKTAETACSLDGTRGVAKKKIEQDCMSDLLEDFITDLDNAALTTYHASFTS